MADSFHDVLGRIEQGDERASAELFYRFAHRLSGLARKRLAKRLTAKVDAEDITQSVFRTFFRRHAEGEFQLEGWDGLWGLLVLITLRKCGRQAATFDAACRDIRREVQPAVEGESPASRAAVAREPRPDEVVAISELIENIMTGLSETQREILSLRLQGYTNGEIAEQIGRTERTVYRTLLQIKARLLQLEVEVE